PCALVLGDNIFYGHGLPSMFARVAERKTGATVFGYFVQNPEEYGVAELDGEGRVIGLEEKPKQPRSSYAVTGLYFYDADVVGLAETLKPSARGELEITDLNRRYLERGQLHLEKMGRGVAWLDTGTHDSLLQASHFIQTIQGRQGLMVSCPEEIAFAHGWIDKTRLMELARSLAKTGYGQYLLQLAERGRQ
ncbi:MAG: sugar phosphate nucleotidyltransferase, partial [Polyangia bacterium]